MSACRAKHSLFTPSAQFCQVPRPTQDTPTPRKASPGSDGILGACKRGVAEPRGHRGCGVG
eukprot:841426-Lingulodinium_polyedra.AAC.1